MKCTTTVLLLVWISSIPTLKGQDHCTTPATIVSGVECNLVSTAAGLLLPCNSPSGFYFLPPGTSVMIDYTPSSCSSICLQGSEVDIFCAQVVGGEYHELCAGQSLGIGGTSLPGSTYTWQPAEYISCVDCPFAIVTPPADAIYMRTEASVTGMNIVTFYNIDVITCTGTLTPDQGQVQISPVPATSEIRVEAFDFERYRISDLSGHILLSGTAKMEKTIRIDELPAGLYFLQLWGGGKTVVCKFIKEI